MADYHLSLGVVEREFRKFYINIDDKVESFGLLKNSFEFTEDDSISLLYSGLHTSQRHGWQKGACWIKKLDEKELANFPARRFTNSVSAYLRGCYPYFPTPLALIYKGNPLDSLIRIKEGYFISHFVKGIRLYDLFKGLSFKKKEAFLRTLGIDLKHCAEEGVYPLDFAPRDIVLSSPNSQNLGIPFIVDTEHVEFGESFDEGLIEKQRRQFIEDYQNFVSKKELSKLEGLVFK